MSGEARERAAALAANDAFYAAFASGDLEAMRSLWSGREALLCIHPGLPPLLGREAVLRSWSEILAEPPPITASGAQATLLRGLAFVTCLEHLGDGHLAACNVFVWEDGRFRLVHHQAGALSPGVAVGPRERGTLH